MVQTTNLKNYSDIHYTRPNVANYIINHFHPTGKILEPARGSGVFYELLPGADWCEIQEGRDFFEYNDSVNWIVTNPPFSDLTEWLKHSFGLADNVLFLIPQSKLFSSAPRLKLVNEYGGIKEILSLGTGRDIGFDIGFPFGAFHFKRDYKGLTKINYWPDAVTFTT